MCSRNSLPIFAEWAPAGVAWLATFVRNALGDTNVEVLPATHADFLAALTLYESRPDKGYSLTDCRSMLAMKGRGIAEVLTNDRHFSQEGFTILFPGP